MPNVIYAFPPLYILVLEQIFTAYLIVKLICCLPFQFHSLFFLYLVLKGPHTDIVIHCSCDVEF